MSEYFSFEIEDVPSVVMLSGGLTSAVLLSFLREKELKSSLKAFFVTFNPKQVLKEQKCVEQLAKYYNVHSKILDVSSLYDGMTVPSSLDFQKFNDYYIPFLNSVMISVVAAHVYYIGYKNIIFGTTSSASFHYPDCSLEFLKAQSKAIFYGSVSNLKLLTPFLNSSKLEIMRMAKKSNIHIPVELTWSCFVSYKKPCGKCFGCLERKLSLEILGSGE